LIIAIRRRTEMRRTRSSPRGDAAAFGAVLSRAFQLYVVNEPRRLYSVIGARFAHFTQQFVDFSQIVLTEQVRALQFREVVTKELEMAVVQ
jgi:hypothetical protein